MKTANASSVMQRKNLEGKKMDFAHCLKIS